MKPSNTIFEMSRRTMLSAFAALPALSMLLPGSALAQTGTGNLPVSPAGQTPVTDPLPSWNDTGPKKAIFDFVERVTKQGSPDLVPEAERIATFDNDGTLWAEQPIYFQLAFALDRVKALAPQHPEWKNKEPFASLLKGDLNLRANCFKTFIASGGGIDFMRVFSERVYGIRPEQVVGSSGKLAFELRDGKPLLMKLPTLNFIDDKNGKPIGIQMHIGRRPIAAFGNSDGDQAMLEWTTSGSGARFGLLVHHTDAVREWAYDRKSAIGQLNTALDAAPKWGWTVMDMKNDWNKIFPFGSK